MRAALLAWAVLAALGGVARAQQPPPAPPTKDFVLAATQADQYEITASRVALAESRDPRVRAFAEQMIADHMRTTQQLQQAAQASGLTPPPPAMGGDQAMLVGALQSLRGVDFDRAYARQQTLAHAQALAVQSLYAQGGADPNLRRTAQATVPLIQHHAEEAQQLSAALGGR